MTPGNIRITAPEGEPYQLGQPIWVYSGKLLLAKLDPVPLLSAGTELHIESFEPQRVVREERRHVGRLIFLEICACIAQNFPQIQAISFVLSRQVDLLGGGAEQAAARSETMSRIGADNVRMVPKYDAKPGHFVVTGVWVYGERSYAALMSVLQEERENYRNRPIGAGHGDCIGVVARLRGLVTRRA